MYLLLTCHINNTVCHNEGVSCANVNVYLGKISLLRYVKLLDFLKMYLIDTLAIEMNVTFKHT